MHLKHSQLPVSQKRCMLVRKEERFKLPAPTSVGPSPGVADPLESGGGGGGSVNILLWEGKQLPFVAIAQRRAQHQHKHQQHDKIRLEELEALCWTPRRRKMEKLPLAIVECKKPNTFFSTFLIYKYRYLDVQNLEDYLGKNPMILIFIKSSTHVNNPEKWILHGGHQTISVTMATRLTWDYEMKRPAIFVQPFSIQKTLTIFPERYILNLEDFWG